MLDILKAICQLPITWCMELNDKGLDMEFSVPLDKEEYKLFKSMFI